MSNISIKLTRDNFNFRFKQYEGMYFHADINENGIVNKLSNDIIQNSNIVLFVTEKEVEEIEEIERFIDREYYEVLPQFVIENPSNVISEITLDLN